jgi:tetratricopeptide (TPR) repeat protein
LGFILWSLTFSAGNIGLMLCRTGDSPVGRNSDQVNDPGTVSSTISRLMSWARHAPKGLARVEFDSEHARQHVVNGLRVALADAGTEFHEITLPAHKPAVEIARRLVAELGSAGSGVVSVAGFSTAFPEDVPLVDSLRVLNFNRENIARFPIRQIWWMDPRFTDQFVRSVPDLDSWFILRHQLKEVVQPPEEVWGFVGPPVLFALLGMMTPSPEDARRRAASLVERFERALQTGVFADELRRDLAIPAVSTLLEAGPELEREAQDLALDLARKIADAAGRLPIPKPSLDFFISYAGQDRAWAEWIGEVVKEAGYKTKMQTWDFRPRQIFPIQMQEATRDCDRTLAVISPTYFASSYTPPEWAAALAVDPKGLSGKLVPVRVGSFKPEGLFAALAYIDLAGLDEDTARVSLLEGLAKGRTKARYKPGYPGSSIRSRASAAEKPRFPGTLPLIWNVPHARNPNFTGRKELLKHLQDSLKSGKTAAVTQAISGLGGVGKTQLALEYVYRSAMDASDYKIVWWIRAEEPARLASDYAALAGPLDLPEKDAREQPVIVEAVRNWLEHKSGWLLVFDNVPHPEDVRAYLPRGKTGHVIITSRDPNWGGVASKLPVQVMKIGEAVEFLLTRTKESDRKSADALAEKLGYLPLALEQAGAYIEATGGTLADYLKIFGKHQAELLGRGVPATGYESTVATTWDIAFQSIEKECPAGAKLLNLCAFLAPDDIPRDVISSASNYLPPSLANSVADPIQFDAAVAALRHYSLIEASGKTLSVHRLVQAVVRDRMNESEQKTWAAAAVNLVAKVFPRESDDVRTWPECARLIAHALEATQHCEMLGVANEPTAALMNQAGGYLRGRAQFVEARELLGRALAMFERTYGSDHPWVATALNNLALVLKDLGDLDGAKLRFERAIAIDKKTYGPDHPKIAFHLNNLAMVLRDLDDLDGAKSRLERALAINEKSYGPNHPEVARSLNNLASVLKDNNDLDSAKSLLGRALTIVEEAYGLEHPSVASTLGNLALVLKDQGDLTGAKACLERALTIDERTYGPGHPRVATILGNYASLLRKMGQEAEAAAIEERAEAIRAKYKQGPK